MSSTPTDRTMARSRFFWLSWSMSVRRFLSAPSGLPPSRGRPVHAFQCLDEVRHDRAERLRQRRLAGDQHIVEIAPGVIGANTPDRRLEAPFDAIALDGLADLPGDGEAEARLWLFGWPAASLAIAFLGLEHKGRSGPSRALADPQKLSPPFQCRHARRCAFGCLCPCLGHGPPVAAGPYLMPRGACGPWHGAGPRSCGHRSWPCACGNHAGACARACSADRSVSRRVSVD